MFKKIMIISILLVLSIGVVSANDNATDDVMTVDSNIEEMENVNVSGNTFEDIQYTIDTAQINSTINLNGTYSGSKEIKITKDITIEGNGATLNGNNETRILNIASGTVILKNINFINAKSETNGGAIYSNGKLTLINCNFTNNTVQSEYDWYFNTHNHNYDPEELGEGGAVYANKDLTIINSIFTQNSAIYYTVFREMDAYGTLDEGNAGAILCKGELYMEKSGFSGNSPTAIVSENNTKAIGCIFENQASCLSSNNASLINSSMSGCDSNALYTAAISSVNLYIENCGFTDCNIRLINSNKAVIMNSSFENNTRNYDSLIDIDDYANITLSSFINNSARDTAILNLNSYDLKDCIFKNNTDATILSNGTLLDDSLNQTYLFEVKIRNKLTKTYYNSGKTVILDAVNIKSGEILPSVYLDYDIYRNGKKYYQEYFYDSLTFPVSEWKVGTYTVVVKYLNSYVKPANVTFKITVQKAQTIIKAPEVINEYKKSQYFKVTVKNKANGKAAGKVVLKLKIGKTTYKVKTNKKGVVKFNTKNLKVGKYKVKITSGNSNYKIKAKSKITIKK